MWGQSVRTISSKKLYSEYVILGPIAEVRILHVAKDSRNTDEEITSTGRDAVLMTWILHSQI